MVKASAFLLAAGLCAGGFGCGSGGPDGDRSEPIPAVARAERAFQECLDWRDRHAVALAKGADRDDQGIAVAELARHFEQARENAKRLLAPAETAARSEEDRLAVKVMADILSRLGDGRNADGSENPAELHCGERSLGDSAAKAGLAELKSLLYGCFSRANETLTLDGEKVDRVTLLGRLASSRDAAYRRRVFFALEPFWRAVNGDNRPGLLYRRLIELNAEDLRRRGSTVEAEAAIPLGLQPETVERWLVSILEKWADRLAPAEAIEPWDVWSQGGAAGALLDGKIPVESLRGINDAFYRGLGADLESLGLRYDLAPRPGKTPVAFTDFGRRNRRIDGSWERGRFWIFATYREGGLGNLVELLHETGHCIHIASIKTRPAFQDWPDSNVFTEGLADLAALEAYQPEWQERFLGQSIPLRDSIRSQYAPIVLDAAWGLFEIRLHRDPSQDPNQVWSDITSRYLRVRPHPGISWWALRGQLVEPGYMLNYGIGAVLIADIRAKARQDWGPFMDNPEWLGQAAESLYRFGRQRSSSRVLRDFLGREPSSEAILADMSRASR